MEKFEIPEALKVRLRLYQMAMSDDKFNAQEIKTLYAYAKEREIPDKSVDEILLNSINLTSPLPNNLEEKVSDLYDLASILYTDRDTFSDKYNILKKYVGMFGFIEENAEAIVDYLINSIQQSKSKSEILYELKD